MLEIIPRHLLKAYLSFGKLKQGRDRLGYMGKSLVQVDAVQDKLQEFGRRRREH